MNKVYLLNIREFFEAEWSKQKEHLILWWPICLGLGISIYYSLLEEPSFLFLFFATLISGVIALFLKITIRLYYLPLFVTFLVLLGMTAGTWRSLSVEHPKLTKEYRFADVRGVIQKIEEREGGAKRLLLGDLSIEGVRKDQTPYLIQVTMRQKRDIQVGQYIAVLASLRPPSPPVMPGSFDFQRFFYFKGIGGTGFTISTPEIIKESLDVLKLYAVMMVGVALNLIVGMFLF